MAKNRARKSITDRTFADEDIELIFLKSQNDGLKKQNQSFQQDIKKQKIEIEILKNKLFFCQKALLKIKNCKMVSSHTLPLRNLAHRALKNTDFQEVNNELRK